MKKDIRIEAFYPFPRERVWEAIADSRAIAAWLMPNDFVPVVGHKFKMTTRPRPGFDGTVHCQVLELDKPARVSFSWVAGSQDTVVTFSLEPVATGTRLILEHTGFRGLLGFVTGSLLGSGWK